MAAKHLLYLTNECIVSLVARGGHFAERTVFPVSGSGRDDYERHVQTLRKVPTNIITDLVEEDFRLDTIPHLRGGDQEAVLNRKLSQLFRNTPYRFALAQGREPEGRRDDRVMYTAITNGEVLRPWVEVLERLQVPVNGIHSSAVFSGQLLTELRLPYAHTLLVTFTPGDAIRQTYFRNKEIKFSRLTPIALEEGETLGGLLSGEIGRTWQYLDTLRYFAAGEHLDVCVLVHASDRAAAEPQLKDYDQIHYHLLDIGEVAGKLGLKPPPPTSSAEGVLAHLFLRHPGENHFASPELRRFGVLRKARNAIFATAGVFVAAGLGYAGWNLSFALSDRGQSQQTVSRIEALNRELEALALSAPVHGVGGPTMRDAVAFYSGSLREYPTVAAMLVPVSVVLERYPGIRLTQIVWQAADDANATPILVATTPRDPPPLKAVTKGPPVAAPTGQRIQAVAPEGLFSSGRHAVALLEGTVTIDGLGFREALSQVEALVADIGSIPGYKTSLVTSPLDLTTRSAISAQLGERTSKQSQARFSVRISLATAPPA